VLGVSVAAFGFAWWLGLHLLACDVRKPVLHRTSMGLPAYAGVPAFDPVLLAVPALARTGAIVCWLPARYDRWWRFGVLPLLVVAFFSRSWWWCRWRWCSGCSCGTGPPASTP
jgi:hypothetical protein